VRQRQWKINAVRQKARNIQQNGKHLTRNFLRVDIQNGESMKKEFLKKPIANSPTQWGIVTSEEEFHKMQEKYVDKGYHDEWVVTEGNIPACTHFYDRIILVCFDLKIGRATCVHEAVHVFDKIMADMGEVAPGEEVRAYGIQHVYQEMRAELKRRKNKKKVDSSISTAMRY